MPDSQWELIEHRGPQGLAALEADWRRLFEETPDPAPWHSHEAYSAYMEHLCPAPELSRCFALSDGRRVRAILPIEERTDHSFSGGGLSALVRVWGMPWREGWWVTDAIGPEDDARAALLPAVLAHLRRAADRPALLVLGRSWDGSVMWDGLAGESPMSRFSFEDGGEYLIPTDMTVDAFMQRLSRNSRQVLRGKARKFEALDRAEYRRVATPGDAAAAYEDFLEVEASGWKGAHGSSVRQNPALESFHRALLERLRLDGHCEVHSLYAEGRCIASAFCVVTRGECAVFKIGYDEAYSRVSPGRVCNHKIVESCCEDPDIREVSLVSTAPWVRHWRPSTRGIRREYVALRPVRGALLLAGLRLRYGAVRSATRAIKAWRRRHAGSTQEVRPEAE